MSTAYHAKYLAHELTKRCPPDSVEKLAGALNLPKAPPKAGQQHLDLV